MENTIDTLNIEIKTSAKNASTELSELANKLRELGESIRTISAGGLANVSNELKEFSNSLSEIKVSNNLKGLSELADKIQKINKLETNNLINVSMSVREFYGVLYKYSKIDINNNDDVKKAIENIGKLGNLKIDNSKGFVKKTKNLADVLKKLSNVQFSEDGAKNIVKSIKKLSEIDLSNTDSESLKNIAKSLKGFDKIKDVSSSVNRFVSALARLASAGIKTKSTAKNLPLLSEKLKKTIAAFKEADNVSQEVITFTSSISQLANAGSKTQETARNIGKLGGQLKNFFIIMSKVPNIKQSTIQMTQALAQLASQGGKVGTASKTLNNTLQKFSGIGNKVSAALKNIGNSFINAAKKINPFKSSVNQTSLSLKSLIGSVVAFKGFQQLGNFSKKAIELGSDIVEVENVVDVSFGRLSKHAYDFAETATEKFGLSQLAAKNYAGTMMAILKSSDVAETSAAKMSTTLAGLAGDLASFYNIETDEAFYKIRAGIAGEVMPLRQLGINMTVANLEAYALANGIEKTYNNMSQAEKTLLRYNYLMAQTTSQQGDFTRTSGTWANQVRILKLNFDQLSASIGQGFISALLPVVKVINSLMQGLYALAERFRVFMYTLTGYKGEGSQSGIVDEFAGVGDVADDASKGMDNATDSAKKLKAAIGGLSFDKLNVISTQKDKDKPDQKEDITGKLDNLGKLDVGSITDAFQNAPVAEAISELARKIREAFLKEDWESLGLILGNAINSAIQKFSDFIDWNNIGAKITYIITAFTTTFNSLVSNINWNSLGVATGKGIDTIVNSLNLLITGIDFKTLGSSFSEGINGIFETVNWENLGKLIGSGFMIPWNILYGLVTNLNWKQLGTSFAEGVNGIFSSVNFTTIGLTISKGLNGIGVVLTNFTQTVKWSDIAKNIYEGLNTAIYTIQWSELGKSLSNFVVSLLNTIYEIAKNTDWQALGRGIGEFLSNIDWLTILSTVFKIISEVMVGLIEGLGETGAGKVIIALGVIKMAFSTFDLASGMVTPLMGVLEKFKLLPTGISQIIPSVGTSIGGIGGTFSKLAPMAGSAITGAVGKLGGLVTAIGPYGWIAIGVVAGAALIIANWDKVKNAASTVKDWIVNKWNELKNGLSNAGNSISSAVSTAWNSIKTSTGNVFNGIGNTVTTAWKKATDGTNTGLTSMSTSTNTILGGLKTNTDSTFDSIGDKISKTWSNSSMETTTKLSEAEISMNETLQRMNNNSNSKMMAIKNNIVSTLNTISTTMKTRWTEISNYFQNVTTDIAKKFEQLPRTIASSLGNLYSVGRNAAQQFANGFRSVHIPVPKVNVSYTSVKAGDKSIQIPNFSVQWFATGGFPEDGFFFANHNELVGKFSNGKTVVANNEQIITGISQGVASAINGTLVPILKSMNNSDGTTVHIEMDNDGIFKIVQEQSQQNFKRTGKYGIANL